MQIDKMTWMEEIDRGEETRVQCPKCCKEFNPKIAWEFIDGEERVFQCECGNHMALICNRPIIFQVYSEYDD